jgi:hypothetical protein
LAPVGSFSFVKWFFAFDFDFKVSWHRQIEECDDLDADIDRILDEFIRRNSAVPILYAVMFY